LSQIKSNTEKLYNELVRVVAVAKKGGAGGGDAELE